MTEPRCDVALSFAGEQRKYVQRVGAALEAAGVRCFFDEPAVGDLCGEELVVYFDRVYRQRSRFVVVFVSSAYGKKVWPRAELRSSLARAIEENGAYILPVRFDDTELPGLLPTIGYLDAHRMQPDHVAQVLLHKLRNNSPRGLESPHERADRVYPKDIRQHVNELQRALLDRIFAEFNKSNATIWPTVREIQIEFGKAEVEAAIGGLPAGAIFIEGERYHTSLLGVLLSTHGPLIDVLLERYLDYWRTAVKKDSKRDYVKSDEIVTHLALEEEQSRLLSQALLLGELWSGQHRPGGGHIWVAGVPADIVELLDATSILAFVHHRAIAIAARMEAARVPAAPRPESRPPVDVSSPPPHPSLQQIRDTTRAQERAKFPYVVGAALLVALVGAVIFTPLGNWLTSLVVPRQTQNTPHRDTTGDTLVSDSSNLVVPHPLVETNRPSAPTVLHVNPSREPEVDVIREQPAPSAVEQQPGLHVGTLAVVVRNRDRRPILGAHVTVTGLGATPLTSVTDALGIAHFAWPCMRAMLYNCQVRYGSTIKTSTQKQASCETPEELIIDLRVDGQR